VLWGWRDLLVWVKGRLPCIKARLVGGGRLGPGGMGGWQGEGPGGLVGCGMRIFWAGVVGACGLGACWLLAILSEASIDLWGVWGVS